MTWGDDKGIEPLEVDKAPVGDAFVGRTVVVEVAVV